jgi:hypothetical protein
VARSAAAAPTVIGQERHVVDAGHMAWGVLLIAFAVFCMVCVITGLGVNYFLFQSTVPMQTVIRVGRGTVTWTDATLIPQATRTQIELFNRAVVSTDPISQATLFVYDAQTMIAAITLRNDTAADIEQVTRPRFDWSSQRYTITLENVTGEFDIHVPAALPRELVMTFVTPVGALARMIKSGDYTVRITDTQLQVITDSGEALVSMRDNPNYAVPPGQRGTLQLTDGMYAIQPARINLLGNRTFEPGNIVEVTTSTPREQTWGCTNVQNGEPSGFFALTQIDGFSALRLGRGGGAETHGETTCTQYLTGASGQQGRDVSTYSYLGLRADFKIVGHSLSTCGEQGSECPLMLRMEYIPATGGVQTWIHGFYTRVLPGIDSPVRCDSCTLDHEIVNEGAWYAYDSGNLLALFPPDQRPRSILNFRFYSSGHEYDVYVREVSLLVGLSNPAPG